jgi:hypothetical protein
LAPIKPALGGVPLTTLTRKTTEVVEQVYADLRRCRACCDGRVLIDHRTGGQHDCAATGCKPHQCLPHSPSTVGRVHPPVGGTYGCAALGMGAVQSDGRSAAPSKPRPNPPPPTPAETARMVEEATRQSAEWGLFLWLAVVTGARRGELRALRWADRDLDSGVMTISRSYVWGGEKDAAPDRSRPPV